jgi:flagella basal body P-ring formation protein FlgA
MKRSIVSELVRVAGAVAVGLAALAAPAYATDTVTLKSEAYVRGSKVLLGDIADIQGENADALKSLEIAAAPTPGSSRQVNASLVNARIQTAGLPPSSVVVTGSQLVRTTAMQLEITRDMLEGDLRQFIETNMPWNAADAVIDVEVPSQTIAVSDGDVTFTWRPSPNYNYVGTGAFRGEIRVDGSLKKTVLCKANIEAYSEVVVAARDITRGKPVGPADVTLEKRALSTLPQGVAENPDEIIGCVARTNIYQGQPVIGRNTAPKMLIKRGQLVNVQVQVGQLIVRCQATAKTDAREGDLLVCVNTDSKQEFQGVVLKDGTVVLQ